MTESEPGACRTALLDACVLVPMRLTNVLLWLAEAELFEPLWSDAILDEVQRNLPKLGTAPAKAARRVASMRRFFGAGALVDDYESLIPEMTCDAKDRHVLAAAVRSGADALMTFNLKDFPPESTDSHGIAVVHPTHYLTRLLLERPSDVLGALERGVATLRNPPQTLRTFLASLTSTVPLFAHTAADLATEPRDQPAPFAALVQSDKDEALAAFGEPGDFSNPAQVGLAWWIGILEDLDLARNLTFEPSAWGDYQWAIDILKDKSLASKVIPAADAPHHVAFMRFVPDVADASRAFAGFVTSATALTLIRVNDGTWRAWGLGSDMPAARDVIGADLVKALHFSAGGGTSLVFEWLTRVAEPDPPIELIWGSLDDPLRRAFAQDWLLNTGRVDDMSEPERDALAAQLAARASAHALFKRFFRDLIEHLQYVYREVDGEPCIIGATETVGVDLELIGFCSEAARLEYDDGGPLRAHTFITRYIGDGERDWVIAANARRLPVPGWPSTEQELPGLRIDGNTDSDGPTDYTDG